MKVPDVVQAFRRITEFRAVCESPIQFWFGAKPNNWKIGFSPSAPRMPLNSPSGCARKIHRTVTAAEDAIAGK